MCHCISVVGPSSSSSGGTSACSSVLWLLRAYITRISDMAGFIASITVDHPSSTPASSSISLFSILLDSRCHVRQFWTPSFASTNLSVLLIFLGANHEHATGFTANAQSSEHQVLHYIVAITRLSSFFRFGCRLPSTLVILYSPPQSSKQRYQRTCYIRSSTAFVHQDSSSHH
jgi:hypothetical protein